MDARELKYINALNSIPGVGPATLRAIKNHFGSFEEAWRASEETLRSVSLGGQAREAILWKRPSLHPDREMEKLVREGIWLTAEDAPEFPPRLREIANPPLLLYGRGKLRQVEPAIAIVGTRRPTHYGLEACEIISHELASFGAFIVSGLAMGIDARAHEAALDAKGYTAAVLGSGINPGSIFPMDHVGLARRIVESGGVVLSEYAPGTPAVKEHFPARNRIIAGLSQGVLVVEAREKSGALITARFALEQNREVFALPGSIFSPTSKGPHKLIQEGAKLIERAADILEELGIEYTKEKERKTQESLTPEEKIIFSALEGQTGIDAIKEKTGLAVPAILASLSLLELKGLIKNFGQGVYQRISNS